MSEITSILLGPRALRIYPSGTLRGKGEAELQEVPVLIVEGPEQNWWKLRHSDRHARPALLKDELDAATKMPRLLQLRITMAP